MDAKKLIDHRKQAERAVAGMADGELKVKAFEVILGHLLGGRQRAQGRPSSEDGPVPPAPKGATKGAPAKSVAGRILALRGQGFFKTQRTIGEVREQLGARGWHYPLTTLSGKLQTLVRQRNLRRERIKEANKKLWKYSNP